MTKKGERLSMNEDKIAQFRIDDLIKEDTEWRLPVKEELERAPLETFKNATYLLRHGAYGYAHGVRDQRYSGCEHTNDMKQTVESAPTPSDKKALWCLVSTKSKNMKNESLYYNPNHIDELEWYFPIERDVVENHEYVQGIIKSFNKDRTVTVTDE